MKKNTKYKVILTLGICILGVFLTVKNIYSQPQVTVWSWERPDDVRFLRNYKNTALAFYAGTITITNNVVSFKPRLNPLLADPNTKKIIVIRIEHPDTTPLNVENISTVATILTEQSKKQDKSIIGLQTDFDASTSEINWYQNVLNNVKKNLPSNLQLSMTALASWCTSQTWLSNAPTKEVVPMFYRLGADEKEVRDSLNNESFVLRKECQAAVGVSLDEPLPPQKYLKNKRIYIFNNSAWTEADFGHILGVLFN